MAAPLTDLIKGAQMFKWTTREQAAFEKLKEVVCSQRVLQLPDFTKPFEIHTDAFDQASGVVLFQEGHPIAYESKKNSEVESRWPTHEKEMLAIVYALRKWRHYVQDKFTQAITDNISLKYFQSQPRLSAKQMRWQDLLAEFDLEIIHKKGKLHTLLDTLSRMPQIQHISVVTSQACMEEIQQAQEWNVGTQQLKEDVESGRTTHGMYRLHKGLLWNQKRVVIPNDMQLKAKILKELHDGHLARHGGQKWTLLVVKKYFMWLRMEEEIIDYVCTCKV